MPTDRSLWVEDRFALRCRGCSEKFTTFRRRHHCRRCGQVFCYECLHSAQHITTSQGLMSSLYEWLSPSPTRAPHSLPDTTAATALPCPSLQPLPVPSIAADEYVLAELSTRLCRRCAATILENVERESSAPRLEFRPSSNTNKATTSHPLATPPSPATAATAASLLSVSPPPTATPLREACETTLLARAASVGPLATGNAPTSTAGEAQQQSPPLQRDERACHRHHDCLGDAEERKHNEAWRVTRHEETAEEREVTYSIERVQHRVPASMAEWWANHQGLGKVKEQKRLSTSSERSGALLALTTPGAVVHELTGRISFNATFCVVTPKAPNAEVEHGADGACRGSAASHAEVHLSDEETEFLDACSVACTAHILSRIRSSLESSLPGSRADDLSKHLGAVAWHVVRHSVVALGATINEHVAMFCVSSPTLSPQCIIYPGLVCAQRLPSKRTMTACDRPRVLLLAGHLLYPVQPAEDLIDYVHSYSGYLDKLCQRLIIWGPDVIVVEGGMHHYLREKIEAEGHMRLLLHAGRHFLMQLSWCLHADIIADLQYVSVADLATTTPMGECARFEVIELAEEERFCAFSGFDGVCFHTLVFRGSGGLSAVRSSDHSSTSGADRGSATQHQWGVVMQLAREAITAAYHAAMQSHWVHTLLHYGANAPSSFVEDLATAVAVSTKTGTSTSCLTLNVGCQYPSNVLSACRSAGAASSLVRDTIVLNVVHMDHLFECSSATATVGGQIKNAIGTSSPSTSTAAAAANTTSTLMRPRSFDLMMDAYSPASHPSSAGVAHMELAPAFTSKLGNSALTQPSPTRAESAAANAYAVVQREVSLTFYSNDDDSLYTFLFSRCTAAEGQLLCLHGGHRVRVTSARAASGSPAVLSDGYDRRGNKLIGADGSSGHPGAAASTPHRAPNQALEEAQQAAFHLATMRRIAARTFAPEEATDATCINAWLASLRGYFSLQVCGEVADDRGTASAPAPEAPPIVDVRTPLCPPHLLNFSTGAFLEWVLYGWMPLLSASTPKRVRLVFTFHPDVCTSPALAPAGSIGSAGVVAAVHRDTVTLVIDPVPLLHIQYPAAVFPSPPALSVSGRQSEVSRMDAWYALHDAEELEQTLDCFHHSLKGLSDVIAPSLQEAPVAVDKHTDVLKAPLSQSNPLDTRATWLRQLCDQAKDAVEALRQSRTRGEVGVAVFLGPLRQRLIPTLMGDYRAWQAEARRTSAVKATPASLGMATSSRDGPDTAAAMHLSVDSGMLRRLEGCYFHPERAQWIRLGEPASLLAIALELLYRDTTGTPSAPPASPTTANDSIDLLHRGPLSAATGSAHVSFAVNTEASSVPSPVSSLAASSAHTARPSSTRHHQQLLSTPTLTRAEALDALRHCDRADADCPVSLPCSLRGYKPVLPLSKAGSAGGVASSISGGAASTVSAVVEASADGDELLITVEVLFPHAFAALHVLYTDGAPLDLPAALLRSRPHMTDGGKSQSRFFVTEDGRFLVKCVKPMELRYFHEWAPRYFARMAEQYSSSTTSTSSPSPQNLSPELSTLSKILGLYVVHVQGSRNRAATLSTLDDATSPQQQHYVRSLLPDGVHCFLVMEQLLFKRPVRETWDLKGSQRNRTTDPAAAVRLDVDLVQERLRHGDFFFCTPEAKSLLMDHLARDTQLLSSSGIMDYSLMAAVGSRATEDGRRTLYVGMIDFLHPYTSAKVLESKMKSGLDTVLGYGRRGPTIIDPSSYAARFVHWMKGYFSGVPDRLFPLTNVRLPEKRKEDNVDAVKD
ncbi:putative phosphatidylinositol (3 5) kinase [Leptomonas seymouri]|uniref:Putative phosphatidylinositol (3 5) kinase n=1 Tax=Leptomonas seymouri TaxID=5684 RepID=A0A0N1PAZ0_LEPSE|nr:putative phosphatidylinositol (3 5) kinase [Leptomonas seymouri]|eukprot:KPI84704.1 putative phosphatidylinositol (3 5) kinase [Leptomonas seymouri]